MKMRIGLQLAALSAFPIVAAALLVAGISFGIGMLQTAKNDLGAKTTVRGKVRDIAVQVGAGRSASRDYVLIPKASALADQAAAFANAHDDIRDALKLSTDPTELATIRNIDGLVTTIEGASIHLTDLAKAGDAPVLAALRGKHAGPAAAAARDQRTIKTAAAAFAPLLKGLIKQVNADAQASSDHFDGIVRELYVVMIVAGLLTVAITGAISFLVARRMARRLARVSSALADVVRQDFAQLSAVLVALSQGDLRGSFTSRRTPLGERGDDEIAAVAHSYDALVAGLSKTSTELGAGFDKLRDLIASVTAASTRLAEASTEASASAGASSRAVDHIAQAIERVASGAADQAQRIGETSVAIEELARTADQIAEVAAHQATALVSSTAALQHLDDGIESLSSHGGLLTASAREASAEATSGNNAVSQTQTAMRQLRDVSQKAAGAMQTLEERSAQVEEIVTTIEEIADQTNLLALNAAIEAARAGDQGRGFAVVADEVRKLAERSAGATKQISSILSSIRSETISAAGAMRTSRDSMDGGLTVAEKAAQSLAGVSAAIATTTSVAEDLAGRAMQMRDASNNVTANMASASAAVEENAAAASEMRSTTNHVTRTMIPISVTATEQSEAAREAAASTGALVAGIAQIDTTARALREQAAGLAELVGQFIIDDRRPVARAAAVEAGTPRAAKTYALNR